MCGVWGAGAADQLIDARCQSWVTHRPPAQRLDRARARTVRGQKCAEPWRTRHNAMNNWAGSSQYGKRFVCEALGLREVVFNVQNDAHRARETKVRIIPRQTSQVRKIAAIRLPTTALAPGVASQDPADGKLVATSTSRRPNSAVGIAGF